MSTAYRFDLLGELPSGVTLLEASAGTGKTFAIAALAARLAASGVPLSELLLVTFTRMATGELRERVRDRLVDSEQGLSRVLQGAPPGGDEVQQLLCRGSEGELQLRRQHLVEALAGFDAATIATTHGFCQHVLAGLGVAGDVERDVSFVEDVSDLVDETVDDLYVRRFHHEQGPPLFDRAEALQIGRAAIDNPHARLEPQDRDERDGHEVWSMRRRLAERVRGELERRKRRLGVMTYDDLLTRLRDTLRDPAGGEDAARTLQQRYRWVLVDEFQDTDPIQWEILQRAFVGGGSTLVLIGDPKQAIYSFRGADVYAYLDAAATATTHSTLDVNWRSDQRLLDAFDALFREAHLGDPRIAYRTVRAADENQAAGLSGAPVDAPLRLRVLHRDHGLVPLTKGGYVSVQTGRPLIAADLAADVVRLLSSGATVGRPGQEERVQPRHLAVLVATNRQAGLVRGALEAVDVPAVINGAGSVFSTQAARDWLRLLEAIERPTSDARARSAALTPFLGWTAEEVATADERSLETVHARLHGLAGVLRQRGVAAMFERISAREGLPRRVLQHVDGERELTDLRHVGQLLHAAATEQQLGAASLTTWLRQRIAGADRDAANEDRSLRLDSDAEAVQVLTIHRSKGLEFPIVYLPYAWEPGYIDEHAPPTFHDPAHGSDWTVDVGKDGPDIDRNRLVHRDEQRGEDLRLLYVALTRARHQVVAWWAAGHVAGHSPLGRLLFSMKADGDVPPNGYRTPRDDDVVTTVEALGRIVVEAVDRPGEVRYRPVPQAVVELEAARFDRTIDQRWGRTSYTGIVAGRGEPQVGSEPEQDTVSDELLDGPAGGEAGPDEERLRAVELPLAAMPGGADVGDLLHRVLEATDFDAPDLDAELLLRLREQWSRRDVELGDEAAVVRGLRLGLETPLGPLGGERRLRDVARADRLDEAVFELPLAGGEHPSGTLALEAVAALLERRLPPGDPLTGYAARLREPGLRDQLRGFLTGFLDLVVRTREGDGRARFTVVDYKTNWLGTEGEELRAWHYRPEALAEAMQRAHYPLQALLYLVALHRYLRWRQPGYEPGRDLGAVHYLFLRGMTGPDVPRVGGQPCGVFSWRPPAGLVEALSDLLDRGGSA